MRRLIAVTLTLLLAGVAAAQILPGGANTVDRTPRDTGKAFDFQIKRRTVSGVVKSLDGEKKTLVLESGKGKEAKDVPVDVGPAVLKAGKGLATFEDIKVGDKITVYGETTVQGGLRAMEMTLPKERMSIAPSSKAKKKDEPKKAEEPAEKPKE
jgi:hypothetical protein